MSFCFDSRTTLRCTLSIFYMKGVAARLYLKGSHEFLKDLHTPRKCDLEELFPDKNKINNNK